MHTAQQKIVVTIDTEAQLLRASCQHVARLIYGDFGTGENYGIMEMMHLANKYDAKLVFFLDIAEVENFGKPVMRKIVQDIYDNGHDVQIHFHVDQLPKVWTNNNLKNKAMLDTAEYDDVLTIFNYIDRTAKEIGIKNIIAFRGGGWRYNEGVIAAMGQFGYKMSFHYNPAVPEIQGNGGVRKPIFQYSNGILEIPLSTYGSRRNEMQPYNIIDGTNNFTNCDDEVIVTVLHSWSLLGRNRDRGHFEPCGKGNYDSLEKFFKFVQRNSYRYKIVDSVTLYAEIENNKYPVEDVFPRRMYIQFDYQNLEDKEDHKTIKRVVPCKFRFQTIGLPVYSADSKRITVSLNDGNSVVTNLVLVNNKSNGARISNLQLMENRLDSGLSPETGVTSLMN